MSEELGEKITEIVGDIFMRHKELSPMILVPRNDGVAVVPVGHLVNSQDFLPRLLSMVKRETSIVAFAAEGSMMMRGGGRDSQTDIVMLCLYEEENTTIWQAEVLRSGEWAELKEWKRMPDGELGGAIGKLPKPPPDPRWN